MLVSPWAMVTPMIEPVFWTPKLNNSETRKTKKNPVLIYSQGEKLQK